MKIIGKPIGTIFPKSNITTEVCNHRYDAVCALSDDTDKAFNTSRYAAELHGFRLNLGLTIFYHRLMPLSDHVDIASCNNSSRVEISEYFQTDKWRDFNYTGSDEALKYPVIPDYYATEWTAAGVAAFSSAVLGQTKNTRYPNHGQQLFDISGGIYGYDQNTESYGTTNGMELFDMLDSDINWVKTTLNKKLTACSYRNGREDGAIMMIRKMLGIRNSDSSTSGDSNTNYGKGKSGTYLGLPQSETTRLAFVSKESSCRWWNAWNGFGLTESEASAYTQGEIAKCISNGGWYNNFIHWHNTYDAGDVAALGRYFQVVHDAIGSNFVWSAGYGEVVEYLFFREIIARTSAYEDNSKVYIVLEKKDRFKGTNTAGVINDLQLDSLQTPISIKIDLTGTSLDGKNIKTDAVGIRSLGSNQYVIDIAFSNATEGYISAVLEETVTPDYYNFSLPTINSATVAGEVLTVVTDAPTKCVVFVAERNAAIDSALLLERSNELSTSHQITLTAANQEKDIYIGVISKEKQSILSNVYRFV